MHGWRPIMTSLVIGGNGFIGTHLVELLRMSGGKVRVLDHCTPRDDFDWAYVQYQCGAISNPDDLDRALDGVDVVYHLASTTVPGTSNADPVADIQGNLVASVRLLDAMRTRGICRIVYFSSGGTVYGNPVRLPIAEDHPTNPISSYGVVKPAVEKYILMYQVLYGIAPVILRPSNPYGSRQGTSGIQGVIAAFLSRLKRGEPITIWGDGSTIRDYIHVSDLVALAVVAARSSETGLFNVGSGKGHSLNDIIETISRVIGIQPVVEHELGRNFDVRQVVLDPMLAERTFGWKPLISLDEGLMRTWRELAAPTWRG
jgi:UDP-glucose 4-epimerase